MKKLLLIIVLLVSVNTIAQETSIDTVVVEPHLSFQNYEHFRKLVLETSDPRVEHLNNFNFEWGIRKTIVVKAIPYNGTLSDGTTHRFEYIETIDTTVADSTEEFVLTLNGKLYYGNDPEEPGTLKQVDENTFNYFDEVNIVIDPAHRSKMQKIMHGELKTRGVFSYVDSQTIKLEEFK